MKPVSLLALLIFLFNFLLTGCTSFQNTGYTWQPWGLREKAAKNLDVWEASGVFSLVLENRSFMAAYLWKQQDASYLIWIHGALNFYSFFIKGIPGKTTFWRSERDYVTAKSPEQLMQKELGWQLPISNLREWLRGLPDSQAHHLKFDSYGHLVQFNTFLGVVHLSNYQKINQADLPGQILIESPSFKIKIIIKAWHIA